MNVVELIRRKRDGGTLSAEEIGAFVRGVTDGGVTDYQAAALLMAIYFRGLDGGELAALTDAMLHSGDVLDLSDIPGGKVDKHSTGGVGDKISLHLAPAVAACGVNVPMISGRGLGHTGGTLDKLEAIPGFRVNLDESRVSRGSARVRHWRSSGRPTRLAPADKRLYALRDVTGTVESIPLIAASIMSKKLAEGIDGLVLDVKVGSGAFMKTTERARELARTLVDIGRRAGKRVTAFLTDMDQPLGRWIGNAVEVHESLAVLEGRGEPDLVELTLALGGEMLRARRRGEAMPRTGASASRASLARRLGAGALPPLRDAAGRAHPGDEAAGFPRRTSKVEAGGGLRAAHRRRGGRDGGAAARRRAHAQGGRHRSRRVGAAGGEGRRARRAGAAGRALLAAASRRRHARGRGARAAARRVHDRARRRRRRGPLILEVIR